MSWEKQRNPRRVGQTVQQSGVWSPDASLQFGWLALQWATIKPGRQPDLGGLPTDPSQVTRRKKECMLDLKIVWQDQMLIILKAGSFSIHKTGSYSQDLVWNNNVKSSSRACTPWQIYNRSLSWSLVVLCLYQNNQSKAKKALSPSISA